MTMSSPEYAGESPRGTPKLAKIAAGVAAVAVLAFGASHIAKSSSSSPTNTSQSPPGGQAGAHGAPPGMMGSAVSGATLTKLKTVATARYPGTVEHAMKLPDGSYVVHVIRSGGQEVHVLVSKHFKITGTQHGGPGGGAPPAGQSAPGGGTSGSQSS
jgi:hypothetical protein